ncbi:MAG: DNA polymerase I [Clostridia bacterium]|nr:DNA polymerase I [Clostridia bacterium]
MNKIVLLDSNSLLNRAYYAINMGMTDSMGRPTNAVYGFTTMLLKIINELQPTHIVATFDVHAPTFRKKKCDYYKATRKPMPEDLRPQVDMIKDLLRAMSIPVYECAGWEADDVLGTLSDKLDGHKIIVTGDRDSLQLVSNDTTVWLTKKGISEVIEYTPDRLAQDGLTPNAIIELKALMGDASDNIKGAPGVGEKTAMNLIKEYGNIDNIYANLSMIKGALYNKLADNKDIVYESKWLATIVKDAPIDIDVDAMRLRYPFDSAVKTMMEGLSFKSLIGRLAFENKHDSVQLDRTTKELASLDDIANLCDGLAILECVDGIHVSTDGMCDMLIKIRRSLLDEGVDYTEAVEALLSKKGIIFHDKSAFLRKSGLSYSYDCQDVHIGAYIIDSKNNYEKFEELVLEYGEDVQYPAAALYMIWQEVSAKLKDSGMYDLYKDIELPLADVLLDVERVGFRVDKDILDEINEEYTLELAQLTEQIYELAGEKFNINSPMQLGNLLFEKLKLPGGKKTKTGFSSSADILEGIIDLHPIVPLILKYRQLSKLKSTYLDGILPHLDANLRVHTCLKQTQTVTGRLSSTEPNLQNIPVRDKEGERIRRMFVASEGNKLVVADYSQIELRLLAHFSQDQGLVDAYNQGDDVHSATAAAVNGVDISQVTPDMRRRAKAVNFGIIYGISGFGLANNIGVSPKQANEFIEKYFDTYKKVKQYMTDCVEIAKEKGYATTLLGRIRKIPELKSTNKNIQSFGERAAMNMPLQGTAADIIKVAMLKVSRALKDNNLSAKLILQVHDELIVDAPVGEVDIVKQILSDCMSNAVNLIVPLVADVGVGDSWYEAK